MKAAAWPITKLPPSGASSGPPAPSVPSFMKSSNSEYGNWFQRGPPSPFALNNGLLPSPVFNLGGRKVSVRRAASYLPTDASLSSQKASISERSIITPLNTSLRTDASSNQIRSLYAPRSQPPSRPPNFSFERSQSLEAPPSRGGPNNDLQEGTVARKGTLERSPTTVDLGHTASMENEWISGVGLRRSTTFTEGMPHQDWKPLSPRSNSQYSAGQTGFSVINNLEAKNASPSFTSELTLPMVATINHLQANVLDQKSHAISPAYSGRSSMYLISHKDNRKELSSGGFSQDGDPTWNSSASARPPSANPYNLSDVLKTDGKLDSPRSSGYGGNSLSTYLTKPQDPREVQSHLNSDKAFPPSRGPAKVAKSILKKKSAYESGGNFLTFSRSFEEPNSLRGWAGYSNPSAFSSSLRQQAADLGSMQSRQRSSAKKVTFNL